MARRRQVVFGLLGASSRTSHRSRRRPRPASTPWRFNALFARINLWTFRLPPLRERREDIPPNLDYELDRFAERSGTTVRFNREARERFLAFAMSGEATWDANFRDLSAAVTRMATLASGGRITVADVDPEIERLRALWRRPGARSSRRRAPGRATRTTPIVSGSTSPGSV